MITERQNMNSVRQIEIVYEALDQYCKDQMVPVIV